MDIKIKHRIIGIIVLIALAVIFIPLFFTHSDSKETRLSSHVPNPPKKPSIELTIPTVDSASVPATATPPKPVNEPISSNVPIASVAAAPDSTTEVPLVNTSETTSTANSTTALQTNVPQASDTSVPAAATSTPSSTEAAPGTTDAPINQPTAEPAKAVEPTHHVPKKKTSYSKAKYATTQHKLKHVKTAVAGKAWTIQLGSFSEKNNAQKLVKQLRAKGFAAYLNTAKTEHGTIVRVFVGPELKQVKAEQLVAKLRQEFGLKGVVVKYEV